MTTHPNLDIANERRLQAAALRATVTAAGRHGGIRLAIQAIEDRDNALRFRGLLEAVHGIGRPTAEELLDRAGIHPEAALRDERLTQRQRALLVGQLLEYDRTKRR